MTNRIVKSSTSRDEGRLVGPCAQIAGRHPHTNRVGGTREQANKVVDGILRRGDQLETFPASGCKVAHYNRPDIRELIEGPYRIVYRIRACDVEVIEVFHGAQRPPWAR